MLYDMLFTKWVLGGVLDEPDLSSVEVLCVAWIHTYSFDLRGVFEALMFP